MADSSNIINQLEALKRRIPSILIPLSAFFAPWGSGMQQVANFDLSKIFVGLAVLLISYWLLFVRHKFRAFPQYFNYFLLFVILHTFITYVLIFPEELSFGYTGAIDLQGGFIRSQEAKGMVVARFFLFAMFGYTIASLLKTEKQLIALSLAYGAGLVAVMMVGGYSALYGRGLEIRFSGGFLNPNAFGLAAITSIFLNMLIVTKRDLRIWIKVLSGFFIGFALFGVLFSGSRGVMLGLFISFVILLIYAPTLKKKIQLVVGLLMISAVVSLFVPQIVWETLAIRTSIERVRQDRGAKRLDLWSDYLKKVPSYGIFGVGMGHSMEVIKDSWTAEWGVTHNNYLATWVQFGIIGLLLYLGGLWQLWKEVFCCWRQSKRTITNTVFLGYFTCWLVMLFFGDYYGCRDLWFFLGIVAAYGSGNIKAKRVKVLKNLAWVKDSRLHQRTLLRHGCRF